MKISRELIKAAKKDLLKRGDRSSIYILEYLHLIEHALIDALAENRNNLKIQKKAEI